MDKYILSAEELSQLKEYIYKHGFREQTTIAEILDHFACKVEEVKTEYPHLSLETAMERAHKSFGVSGFYPLVKAFQETLQKKYQKIFRRNLKMVATHPLHIALFALINFVVSKAYIVAENNGWLLRDFEINGVHMLVYASFIAGALFMNFVKPKHTAENPIIQAAYAAGARWWIFASIFLPLHPEPHRHVLALAIMNGFAMSLLTMINAARYRTIKAAAAEYHEMMQFA